MKHKIGIVRGAFLNRYEMQFYEPLTYDFDITAFGSKKPLHDRYKFPVIKLPCPMDLPDFPFKMPILNRIFIDAHYLIGLEEKLKGFDIVHTAETYYRYTQQALNARNKGYVKKVVATVLENIVNNNEGIMGRKEFKRRSRTELDHIIALTERTKNVLCKEGADESKISVVGHYIDTKRFRPDYKNNTNFLTLLYCGRLEEYKGVMDILEAINIILKNNLFTLKFRCVFAGAGSMLKKMRLYEDKYGINHYIDHVNVNYDRMPEIYQKADIYLAPSKPTPTWEEQYNTTLLEAQASGLSIITTDSGGIVENVGDAAIIIKPGDVKSLVNRLLYLMNNQIVRRSWGIKARNRAVHNHDISIGASKIAGIYNQLLK